MREITMKDVMTLFGVSRSTLKRWEQQGRLSAAGRTTQGWRYYLLTDIEQLIRDAGYRFRVFVKPDGGQSDRGHTNDVETDG